jgi:hypothetical protein
MPLPGRPQQNRQTIKRIIAETRSWSSESTFSGGTHCGVRRNGGGERATVAHLLSHFFAQSDERATSTTSMTGRVTRRGTTGPTPR